MFPLIKCLPQSFEFSWFPRILDWSGMPYSEICPCALPGSSYQHGIPALLWMQTTRLTRLRILNPLGLWVLFWWWRRDVSWLCEVLCSLQWVWLLWLCWYLTEGNLKNLPNQVWYAQLHIAGNQSSLAVDVVPSRSPVHSHQVFVLVIMKLVVCSWHIWLGHFDAVICILVKVNSSESESIGFLWSKWVFGLQFD